MGDSRVKAALVKLRAELYIAAQTLHGDDLEELRLLISEIQAVLDHTPKTAPFSKVGPV